MIELTRLNNKTLLVNSDLIETIEETPDTVVTLTNGRKLIVLDSAVDIVDKVVSFRYRCFHDGRLATHRADEAIL